MTCFHLKLGGNGMNTAKGQNVVCYSKSSSGFFSFDKGKMLPEKQVNAW